MTVQVSVTIASGWSGKAWVDVSREGEQDLHQHEGIKGLHRVQNRLDQVCPLVHLRLVLPYRPRQRRSLSNDVASKVPR